MLAVLLTTGKLPAAIRPQKIITNLEVKKTAILFINKEKILCESNSS